MDASANDTAELGTGAGRRRWSIAFFGAIAAAAVAAAAFLVTDGDPRRGAVEPAAAQAGEAAQGDHKYPPDGFYLGITVPYAGDRAAQWERARSLERAARAAGYTGAAAYPAPSGPNVCFGKPCTDLGFPAGQSLLVVLEGYPGGPDPKLAGNEDAFVAFQGSIEAAAKAEAARRGFPDASVRYESFSTIEGVWEPPTEQPPANDDL